MNLASMWAGKGSDAPEARKRYTKAVSCTKNVLADGRQNKSDEMLLAVLMLDFYDIVSRRFLNQRFLGTHQDGAVALVKYRGSENFQSNISKGLLLAVRNRLVNAALQKKSGIVFDPDVWADGGEMPHNPATRLDLLASELANLQVLASSLPSPRSRASNPKVLSVKSEDTSCSDTTFFVENLLEKALDLDRRLNAWRSSTPESWEPVSIIAIDDIHPTIRAAGLYGSLCDVYSSLQAAGVYNTWRCTSISLLQIVAKCRQALLPGSVAALVIPEYYATARIQSLVDGVCASVPYFLGNHLCPYKPDQVTDIEFPQFPIGPDGSSTKPPVIDSQGNPVEISQADHMRAAASIGGWLILNSLLAILQAARPAPDARPYDAPPLRLRAGQMLWILGQLKRIQNIYLIPNPSVP
jgi:hypothetical protein